MSILCSNCPLVQGDGLQNFTETCDAMQWGCDSFRGCINEPSQNYFGCSLRGITLFHFLIDAGSWRKAVSLSSIGQNTRLSKRRRICLTNQRVHWLPCTRSQKLFMYISQYRKGFLKGVVHEIHKIWAVVIGRMSNEAVSEMVSKR